MPFQQQQDQSPPQTRSPLLSAAAKRKGAAAYMDRLSSANQRSNSTSQQHKSNHSRPSASSQQSKMLAGSGNPGSLEIEPHPLAAVAIAAHSNLPLSLHAVGLESGMFTDVQVHAFDQVFPLHRVVLCTNPYFRALIFEQMMPWGSEEIMKPPGSSGVGGISLVVRVEDSVITLEAFRAILARIYGKLDTQTLITHNNVLAFLAAGFYFMDSALSDLALAFILKSLNEDNVVNYLGFAESTSYGKYSLQILEECFAYFCSMGSSLPMSVFKQLSWRWLPKVLAADCFFVSSEFERYQFIKRVIQERRERREEGDAEIGTDGTSPPEDGSTSKKQRVAGGEGKPVPGALSRSSSTASLLAGDAEEDIEFVTNLFCHSVFYAQIPFDDLSVMSKDHLVDMSVLSEALWKRCELQRIVSQAPDVPLLGLTTTNMSRVSAHLLPFMTPPPGSMADTAMAANEAKSAAVTVRLEDEKLLSVLCSPIYPHFTSVYKPLRFAVEFTDLENRSRPSSWVAGVNGSEHCSRKSKLMFYAGSLWQIWIDKIGGNEQPRLGVYLKRISLSDANNSKNKDSSDSPSLPANDKSSTSPNDDPKTSIESPSTVVAVSKVPTSYEYIDRRSVVKAKFRLFCYVGRQCVIRNFKPADFQPACASWGWTDDSSALFRSACAEGRLRVCVVLENV